MPESGTRTASTHAGTADKFRTFAFWAGLVVLLVSGSYVLMQLVGASLPPSRPWTYIALATASLAAAVVQWGIFPSRERKRRIIEEEELQTLYAEIERYEQGADKDALVKIAQSEVLKLQEPGKEIFELCALPLRQALVDLYPPSDLIAKSEYDLRLLKDYKETIDDGTFERWEERISQLTRRIREAVHRKETDAEERACEELRAQLKSLRETTAWSDRDWVIGSIYIVGVVYWGALTIVAMVLFGLLPVCLDPRGDIGLKNWAAFGIAGALLAILLDVKDMNEEDVGDTLGKQVIMRTVVAIPFGVVAATLLYAAITGGMIDGKLFPDLPTLASAEIKWPDVGMSVFWGILSGFSFQIFRSLVKLGEGSVGPQS